MTASDTRLLLTRHFVRRFVDNDLLSAHGDRHDSLSTIAAALVSVGVFGAVLLSIKYIFGMSPGMGALSGMEDRLVLVTASLVVGALAAATQWDALSLDARDAAILGPLPVRRRTIVLAKATAVGLLAAGAASAAAVPHVLFPILSVSALNLTVADAVRVLVAHLAAAVAASVFGFSAVLCLREMLRLLVRGPALLRASRVAQTGVVVLLPVMFLLVLGHPTGSAGPWMTAERSNGVAVSVVPAMWFLGAAESLIGDAIVGPWTAVDVLGRPAANDRWEAAYRSYQPRLGELSQVAWLSTLLAVLGATLLYTINARRFPQPTTARAARSRAGELAARLMLGRPGDSPAARAGFTFTASVLVRSTPHRLAVALGGAVALSIVVVTVAGGGLPRATEALPAPLTAWALQTFVLAPFVAALLHAMALPAHLKAGWIVHQCWSGDLRAFLIGVRRAGLALLVLPPVLALLPFHAYALGARPALVHAVSGVLLAWIVLAVVTHGQDRPPFVSSYVPRGNLKSAAPIYFLGIVIFGLSVAALERAAQRTSGTTIALLVVGLAAAIAAGRAGARRQLRRTLVLDSTPERESQTLGLSG